MGDPGARGLFGFLQGARRSRLVLGIVEQPCEVFAHVAVPAQELDPLRAAQPRDLLARPGGERGALQKRRDFRNAFYSLQLGERFTAVTVRFTLLAPTDDRPRREREQDSAKRYPAPRLRHP